MFGYFQHTGEQGLELNDFARFSREFSQVIRENIPTVSNVFFTVAQPMQPAPPMDEEPAETEIREANEQAADTGNPILVGTLLLMPFSVGEECVIAHLEGIDELLTRRIGSDWLNGLGDVLLREFLLVKMACVDSLTGLLSSRHLEEYLNAERCGGQGGLLLISLYPKGTSVFLAKKYQYKVVSLLNSFVENRFPLFYLGQSCFALLCDNCDNEFLLEFVPGLVNYLKRERCYRVHVGSTKTDCKQTEDMSAAESVMQHAWAALHVASRRGPFAFCSYESMSGAADHPFARPEASLSRWLLRHVRGVDQFALLQFSSGQEQVRDAVLGEVGRKAVVRQGDDATFLLLSETDRKAAREVGVKIQNRLQDIDKEQKVNVGITSFPLKDFKKSETLLNCRKALRHADFLDPGAVVVFDAVSLNISGDVYYGEGDLVRAVREYKRGLSLDPGDCNLLNSLGVCHAQMNRRHDAVQCFEKACSSADDQFSALYNLGVEQLLLEEKKKAMQSFELALSLPVEDKREVGARDDICFQLAVLCTESGEYERAVELLLSWSEFKKESEKGKKAARYLGESYYGLKKYKKAMRWLQRAMRYDEFDAEVLGLLGEIYLQENEGDDIALRFCEKSVELNPDSLRLKLGLAKAQIQCGDFPSALKNLQPCLSNKKMRSQALLQRGLFEAAQGRVGAAEKWLVKACESPESDSGVKKEAKYYLNKLNTQD